MEEKNELVVPEIVETQDDEGTDTTDWKAIAETQNESAKQFQGLSKRNHSDLRKLKEDPRLQEEAKKPEEEEEKKEGFNYAEKAYLIANDVQKDEFGLVEKAMRSTGSTLDEVLEDEFFQGKLKSLREEQKSKDAIPKGTKRTSTSARDSVDFWVAKGELHPANQRELRQKVVNARIKAEDSESKFTSDPVV